MASKEGLVGMGSGAAAGAMIGSVVPGIGTGIGALGGGILGGLQGLFAGQGREDAAAAQHRALEAAMGRLQEGAKKQYGDRMAAMDKVMGYYQPSQDVLTRLYGGTRPQGSGPAPAQPAAVAPGQAPRPPQQPPGFPAPAGAPGMSRLGF